jgi:hypothetical protein
MGIKQFLFLVLIVFVAACTPDSEVIEVTRPVVVATAVATAVLPLPSPTATFVPTITPIPSTGTPLPTPTHEPEATLEPTAVATPKFIWPAESIIFFNDNSLKKWSPQSGEVTVLAENVDWGPSYGADIATFTREITPTEESALVILHIPTGSELEVARLSSRSFSFSISPNGRWLAYISGHYNTDAPLFVHEIVVNEQQISISDPILTIARDDEWGWLYGKLAWPMENQLSWNDSNGIWLADLESLPIEPTVVIQPSTNTYRVPIMNPADYGKEPPIANTIYTPYQWSPDGRYLLAIEKYEAEGLDSNFRVLEKDTNRSFEIPDSLVAYQCDEALWLDDTHLLHYSIRTDLAYIWHINTSTEPVLELDKTIQIGSDTGRGNVITDHWLALPNNHGRFAAHGAKDDVQVNGLFDLDLEQDIATSLSKGVDIRIESVQWSPTANYVIWNSWEEDEFFLDHLNGSDPTNMSAVFGERPCCLYWYEE